MSHYNDHDTLKICFWWLHLVSLSAGPAVSLVPLIISSQGSSVATAVLCLTGTLSLQAFCYAGFHAYVQVSATTYCPSSLYNRLL